jgi:hypothetical protein
MGEHRGSGGVWLLPLPLLHDIGIGLTEELTEMSEGFSAPIAQILNALGDLR